MCSAVVVVRRHHRTAKGRSFANAGGATDGSGLVTVAAQRPLLTPVSGTHARTQAQHKHTHRSLLSTAAALVVVGYDGVLRQSQAPVREAFWGSFPLDFYFESKVQRRQRLPST